MKKLIVVLLTAGLLLIGATGVLAATWKSPAEIYAELKGITVDEAYKERIETRSSFGRLAAEAGILDEFQTNMLENRKEIIEQRVKDGLLTQEQADDLIKKIEDNQAWCDGTGLGPNCGRGFGMGAGGCWRQNR